MNRREMLRKSVWNMAKVFPAMLAVAEGLRGWLQEREGVIPCKRAACFPKGPQKPGGLQRPQYLLQGGMKNENNSP